MRENLIMLVSFRLISVFFGERGSGMCTITACDATLDLAVEEASAIYIRQRMEKGAVRMKDMMRDIWNRILVSVGWSDRQAIVFLFFLWLLLVMPFLVETSALNNTLLWVTGIIILLYTVETHGLRVELIRQNEIAVQPLVTAGIERRPAEGSQEFEDVLVFRNIGHGPALFVQPADIQFHEKERFTARFDVIDVIDAGKNTTAGVNLHMDGEHSLSFIEHLDPRYANKTYNVRIAYEDINCQPYGSVVQMGKDGVRLLWHQRIMS